MCFGCLDMGCVSSRSAGAVLTGGDDDAETKKERWPNGGTKGGKAREADRALSRAGSMGFKARRRSGMLADASIRK